MFAYPKQAAFDRVVPKARIYAHARTSKRMKELLAAQIAEIRWTYKLSPETLNLPARDGVQEIQVFAISLKTPSLDRSVLEFIDRAIPFPLFFQILHGDQTCFAASYKRPAENSTSSWVREALFLTPWDSSFPLHPLPVALDLASLYGQMVQRHIPLPARPRESLADHVSRFRELENKEKLRRSLEARLSREKQFNRKVELNAQLRGLTSEVTTLHQT